jgi:hypothetical protein
MELSVLNPVPGTGRYRLQLQRGSWASTALSAELSVCDNPCCSCAEIQFCCSPEDAGPAGASDDRGPFRFALDVLACSVASDGAPLDLHPGSIDLANAVALELTPEDWQALLRYFLAGSRSAAEAREPCQLNLVPALLAITIAIAAIARQHTVPLGSAKLPLANSVARPSINFLSRSSTGSRPSWLVIVAITCSATGR